MTSIDVLLRFGGDDAALIAACHCINRLPSDKAWVVCEMALQSTSTDVLTALTSMCGWNHEFLKRVWLRAIELIHVPFLSVATRPNEFTNLAGLHSIADAGLGTGNSACVRALMQHRCFWPYLTPAIFSSLACLVYDDDILLMAYAHCRSIIDVIDTFPAALMAGLLRNLPVMTYVIHVGMNIYLDRVFYGIQPNMSSDFDLLDRALDAVAYEACRRPHRFDKPYLDHLHRFMEPGHSDAQRRCVQRFLAHHAYNIAASYREKMDAQECEYLAWARDLEYVGRWDGRSHHSYLAARRWTPPLHRLAAPRARGVLAALLAARRCSATAVTVLGRGVVDSHRRRELEDSGRRERALQSPP